MALCIYDDEVMAIAISLVLSLIVSMVYMAVEGGGGRGGRIFRNWKILFCCGMCYYVGFSMHTKHVISKVKVQYEKETKHLNNVIHSLTKEASKVRSDFSYKDFLYDDEKEITQSKVDHDKVRYMYYIDSKQHQQINITNNLDDDNDQISKADFDYVLQRSQSERFSKPVTFNAEGLVKMFPFDKIDSNKDGFVTLKEYSNYKLYRGMFRHQNDDPIKKAEYELYSQKYLSLRPESKKEDLPTFGEIDINDDGFITHEEDHEYNKKTYYIFKEWIMILKVNEPTSDDSNKDNGDDGIMCSRSDYSIFKWVVASSYSELSEESMPKYEDVDVDFNDGYITRKEWNTFLSEMCMKNVQDLQRGHHDNDTYFSRYDYYDFYHAFYLYESTDPESTEKIIPRYEEVDIDGDGYITYKEWAVQYFKLCVQTKYVYKSSQKNVSSSISYFML